MNRQIYSLALGLFCITLFCDKSFVDQGRGTKDPDTDEIGLPKNELIAKSFFFIATTRG